MGPQVDASGDDEFGWLSLQNQAALIEYNITGTHGKRVMGLAEKEGDSK